VDEEVANLQSHIIKANDDEGKQSGFAMQKASAKQVRCSFGSLTLLWITI
jgi:hypothetical protein